MTQMPPTAAQVEVQPTPFSFGADHTQDGAFVVMVFKHFTGQNVFFFDPAAIGSVIQRLTEERDGALAKRNGIQVPPHVVLDAQGRPMSVVPPVTTQPEPAAADPDEPLLRTVYYHCTNAICPWEGFGLEDESDTKCEECGSPIVRSA